MHASLLAPAIVLTAGLVQPAVQLGLSAAEWQGLVSNTNGHVSQGYVVVQRLQTADGRTLVAWASMSALDPKGPNGFGVQVYGVDRHFQQWLTDAKRIDRPYILCGRYLLGGGNTLRVWDMQQTHYPLVRRSPVSKSPGQALNCSDLK